MRLTAIASSFLLLLSYAAPAQQASPSPPRAKPTGRITGTVLCSDTHLPARGAAILVSALPSPDGKMPELDNEPGSALLVGSDGTYTVPHLPPGTYVLNFVDPGYLSGLDDELDTTMKAMFAPGQDPQQRVSALRKSILHQPTATILLGETAHLDVVLQRGAVVSGQVRYTDGVPASLVTLMLEGAQSAAPANEQERMMQTIAANVSGEFGRTLHPDDRGHFRLAGLRAGDYRLVVLQPAQASGRDGVQIGDAQGGLMATPHSTRFYAGNTLHSTDATVFHLRAGEEVSGIDITLPLDLWRAVSGSVHAADGRVVSALLTLTDSKDPGLSFAATTEDDGTFRFPQVPAGTYRLLCDKGTISHPEHLPNTPEGGMSEIYTNAFASSSRTITVERSDVTHVDVSLKEIPLPDDLKPENLHAPFGPGSR